MSVKFNLLTRAARMLSADEVDINNQHLISFYRADSKLTRSNQQLLRSDGHFVSSTSQEHQVGIPFKLAS